MNTRKDLSVWVNDVVRDFTRISTANSLRNDLNEQAWEEPLVGFSSGDDSLYRQFKRDISDRYLTPGEFFNAAFPEEITPASDLIVISWALPHGAVIKTDHRKETSLPSERWARARVYGEDFNSELRKYVAAVLVEAGYPAVAPLLSPHYAGITSARYGRASTWSERHAAYAGGLGTFGLCDGLITSVGKAVRFGSVIARIPVPPNPRPYDNHHAYCLFFAKGTCGKCMDRCPVGAITKAGHDKNICSNYTRSVTAPYVKSLLGVDGYACGLCQAGVPCESRIPLTVS